MHEILFPICLLTGIAGATLAQTAFESDVLPTAAGSVKITFFGHASLLLEFANKSTYVDPWGQQADYLKLPKADVILVTHDPGVALHSSRTIRLRDGQIESDVKNGK